MNEARSLRKKASKIRTAQQEVAQARQAALAEKLRNGLQGQRLGKHKVPEGEIDVQLGEDLSESLRALKVKKDIAVLFHVFYSPISPKGIFSEIGS